MGSVPLVLRYISRSFHKEGKSPFSKCTSRSIETKATKKDDGASITTLKGSVTVSTLKMWQARPPLFEFVVSSKEGDDLPSAQTNEGIDPNAYKLMERVGYDFQNPATLGRIAEAKPCVLIETQRRIPE